MISVAHPWRFLFGGMLLGTLIKMITMPIDLPLVPALTEMVRAGGRVSFLLFLPIFVARPLHELFPSSFTAKLLRNRGGLGLMLLGVQIAHMSLVITLFAVSPVPPLPPIVVFGGVVAVSLVAIMGITSFKSVTDRLPKKLVRGVHIYGILYLIFGVFFYDIILSIFTKPATLLYVAFALLYYAALGLRIAAYMKTKRLIVFP